MMQPPPGMLMTQAQWALYLNLWQRACAVQGWKAGDRARRMEVHRAVFGVEKSAKDIDRKGDFDRIKAHFKMLAGDLDGAVESEHPEIGAARRTVVVIEGLIAALALYVEDAEGYVRAVVRDKFGTSLGWRDLRIEPVVRERSFRGEAVLVEGPSEMEQLRSTLAARVDALRRQSGDSVKGMQAKARDLEREREREVCPW